MQEVVASILNESINMHAAPYETAIERTWTSEHTSAWLENLKNDLSQMRTNESTKGVMAFLVVILLIVAAGTFVMTGHDQIVKEAIPVIFGSGGIGAGCYFWGKSKGQP